VIKLATHRLEGVGMAAGSVYAVSTVGSVIGTLLLGFFLLPALGSRTILWGVSIVLLGLGAALAWFEYKCVHPTFSFAPLLVVMASIATVIGGGRPATATLDEEFKLLHETESLYGWVRVIDEPAQGIRWLMADSSAIGAVDLATGSSLLGHQKIIEKLPYFKPGSRKALLIGLGGGHLATALKQQFNITTDAIEIDPAVAQVAQDYFGYKPSGALRVGDARYEIRQLTGKYDFIIHDCFTGGAEPIHLLSLEMLQELQSLLTEDGILALNFVGFMNDTPDNAVSAVHRTLGKVFSHVRTFVSVPGQELNDLVFLASNRPLTIASTPELEDWLRPYAYPLPLTGGKVISDDFNPLESLQMRTAEVYRELLLERMGAGVLVR
jgi:predicted membrane-bound spermidine synthase